jgi:ubiquitin-protein ligase
MKLSATMADPDNTTPGEAVSSSFRELSLRRKTPYPAESRKGPSDPTESDLSQDRRITNDPLEPISPTTTVSIVIPINVSSVGNLICSLRQEKVHGVPENYQANILNMPLRRRTPQGPKPGSTHANAAIPCRPYIDHGFPTRNKRRVLAELQNMAQSSNEFVHFQQIGDSLRLFLGSMEGPPGTPYHGGIFHVLILLPDNYPVQAPHCRFITKIYHPNIDTQGKICLDIFAGNWSSVWSLSSMLVGIASRLDDPGLDKPLVPDAAEVYIRDRALYDEIAGAYTVKYASQLVPTMDTIDGCLQDLVREAGGYENDGAHT